MKQKSIFTSSEHTAKNIQEVSNTVPKRKSITSKQKLLAQVCFITRTATATQQSTAEPMRSKLRLSWRLTARTLRNRCRHETTTILTRNHHHFLHNHFPRRLNPSLLQWLMHLQEINDHKNHRNTKNKEQRQKNDQSSVSHGVSSSNTYAFAEAELLIYEPQLSKQHPKPSNNSQTNTDSGCFISAAHPSPDQQHQPRSPSVHQQEHSSSPHVSANLIQTEVIQAL
jgi:hypothetical protein